MLQPDIELLEPENQADDWGDFSAVINQLEAQEGETLSDAESTEPTEDKSEAVAGLLDVAFTLAEQATCMVSGVEFAFDDKGKQAVIDAAVPVFNKHGNTLMSVFGSYIEEATLVIAVLGLAYASKRQLEVLKAQGGEDGKEESAAVKVA